MSSLSGVKASSSEQHAEMEFKRRSRDYQDCEKFFSWFESRNPFHFEDADLHSLSTGSVSVCGTDNVNCENAESIGECIQKSIDEVNFTEAKIKKKDQLCNLNMMTSSIKIGRKNPICVNPTLLFTRLAAIAQREEDVEQYFDFELTTRPQSLFKNELMRKPDKASLRKVLLTEEIQCSANEVMEITGKYVLDGGALLYRVHWVKDIKFNEVAKAYVNYIRRNYGSAFIVFDGYDSPESIKSNEHLRRAGSKGSTPNIIITADNEVPYTKERFLSNSHNKTQLISFLADHLTLDGQAVHICRGDADTKIVSTALEVANDSTTIVVADDTDVAVMLLYHWNENISDVFFLQERGKKCWSIRKAQLEVLDFKEHLLFIHAWSGCDSTSAIFGKGKSSFLNLVKKSKIIQLVSETICDYWATQSDVGDASMKAFVELYGGNSASSLKQLRYSKYLDMICKGVLQPEKLPPTERAAYYHGLRVHVQVIEWQMLDEASNLDPKEWGWKSTDGYLTPITTDKEIAPKELLKVIRCNCKTSSKNQCGTNICTCRKHGLKCMPACGGCQGESCSNKADLEDIDMSDDDTDGEDGEKNIIEDLFNRSKSSIQYIVEVSTACLQLYNTSHEFVISMIKTTSDGVGDCSMYVKINEPVENGTCIITPKGNITVVITCNDWLDPEGVGIKEYALTTLLQGSDEKVIQAQDRGTFEIIRSLDKETNVYISIKDKNGALTDEIFIGTIPGIPSEEISNYADEIKQIKAKQGLSGTFPVGLSNLEVQMLFQPSSNLMESVAFPDDSEGSEGRTAFVVDDFAKLQQNIQWQTFLPDSKLFSNETYVKYLQLVEIITRNPSPSDVSNLLTSSSLADFKLPADKVYVLSDWPSEVDEHFTPYKQCDNELSIEQGVLLWDARVIVPFQGREALLRELHEQHPGIVQMKGLACSYLWWPGLDLEIENYVCDCEWCQVNMKLPPSVPLHPWEWPGQAWYRIHIDDLGPFEGKMILIIVDAHSKFIDAHVVNSATSQATTTKLRQTFSMLVIPCTIEKMGNILLGMVTPPIEIYDKSPAGQKKVFSTFLEGQNAINTIVSLPKEEEITPSIDLTNLSPTGLSTTKEEAEKQAAINSGEAMIQGTDFIAEYLISEKTYNTKIETTKSTLKFERKVLPVEEKNEISPGTKRSKRAASPKEARVCGMNISTLCNSLSWKGIACTPNTEVGESITFLEQFKHYLFLWQNLENHEGLFSANTSTVTLGCFTDNGKLKTDQKNIAKHTVKIKPAVPLDTIFTLLKPSTKSCTRLIRHQIALDGSKECDAKLLLAIRVKNDSSPLVIFMKNDEKPVLEGDEYRDVVLVNDLQSKYDGSGKKVFSKTIEGLCDIQSRLHLAFAQVSSAKNIEKVRETIKSKGNFTDEIFSCNMTEFEMAFVLIDCSVFDEGKKEWRRSGLASIVTDNSFEMFLQLYNFLLEILDVKGKSKKGNAIQFSSFLLQVRSADMDSINCESPEMDGTFGGGFIVQPNVIDFDYVFENANFADNLTIYLTICISLGLYLIMLVWCRRKDKQDLILMGAAPLPDNNLNHSYLYEILIYTSSKPNSGTDSQISFVLTGHKDDTGVRKFGDSERKIFRRAQVNCFVMTTPSCLGQCQSLRLWHDNSGKSKMASWHLDYIVVRDVQTNEKFKFIAHRWWAVEKDDGQRRIDGNDYPENRVSRVKNFELDMVSKDEEWSSSDDDELS
ncbi:hypothetical protein GQR58_019552 [Nymphon striatum]|nr:hypothetical protein GQR58_019552 [Nymphon striatum]